MPLGGDSTGEARPESVAWARHQPSEPRKFVHNTTGNFTGKRGNSTGVRLNGSANESRGLVSYPGNSTGRL